MTAGKRIEARRLRHVKKPSRPHPPKSFPKTDLLLRMLTVLAIYAGGGGWALYKYYASGADGWAINVKLETSVLPYRTNKRLLVVNIDTLNPRHFETEIDPDKGDRFELRFIQIPSNMKQASVIGEDGGKLIRKVEMLPQHVPYDFLPGLKMEDTRMMVVPAKSTILVMAEIDKNDGTLDKAGKPDFDYVSASKVVHVE